MDYNPWGRENRTELLTLTTERLTFTHTLLLEPIVTAGLMIQCLKK